MKVPSTPPNFEKPDDIALAIQLFATEGYKEIWDKFEENYYSYDELRRKKWLIDTKIPIRNWWLGLKLRRNARYTIINPFQEQSYQFFYSVDNNMLRIIDGFEKEIGRGLIPSKLQDNEEKEKHLWASIMEEAIASSQIEGAVITREQAIDFINADRKPRNEAETMILNNYFTIQFIKENADRKLDEALLLEIQEQITSNTLEEELCGSFRTNDAVKVVDGLTGKIYFQPVKFEHLTKALEGLYAFANDEDGPFIPPIIKAIILHFLVGYLHPFRDGNGRTARALFYWYLIRKGYWWIEYLSISRWILDSKNQYYLAFLQTETDGNDLNYFIYYNLHTLEKAHIALLDYIQKKQLEKQLADKILYQTEGINIRQAGVIAELQTNSKKYFTVSKLEEQEGVSYLTARSDLQGLVTRGILTIKKSGNKQLYYLAE